MKACRFHRSSRMLLYFAMLLYPAVAIGIFVTATVLLAKELVETGFAELWSYLLAELLCTAIPVLLLLYARVSYLFETRKYEASPAGLVLSYGKRRKTVPWDDISCIAVSILNGTGALNDYEKVILCVLTQDKVDLYSNKIIRGYFYCARNPDKFAVIDYDETILKELQLYYPGEIQDHVAAQLKKGLR